MRSFDEKTSGSCRVLLFSDIHLGLFPKQVHQLLNKRVLGAFNHLIRRRNKLHSENISKLVDLIPTIKPDVIVCAGDLTSVSLPDEFDWATTALQPMLDYKQAQFIYVPGNHDAYVKAQDDKDALRRTFKHLNNNLELDSLPAVREIMGVRFILVNPAFPSGWWYSCGDVRPCADALQTLLAQQTDTPTVIVSHFPALNKYGKYPGARHGLRGANILADTLRNKQALTILSGHVHTPYSYTLPNGTTQQCCGSLTLHNSFITIDIPSDKNIPPTYNLNFL